MSEAIEDAQATNPHENLTHPGCETCAAARIVAALQGAGYVTEELDGGFGVVNVYTKSVDTDTVLHEGDYVATLTISRTPGY